MADLNSMSKKQLLDIIEGRTPASPIAKKQAEKVYAKRFGGEAEATTKAREQARAFAEGGSTMKTKTEHVRTTLAADPNKKGGSTWTGEGKRKVATGTGERIQAAVQASKAKPTEEVKSQQEAARQNIQSMSDKELAAMKAKGDLGAAAELRRRAKGK
jgi:hypothetical protein